ncbi:OprD family outer membrane porin [Chromobacterium piscinae]|uniref:OprD family outer membrane porin n=1 Tax=Chromobacterium piscinae TaxID=686831 RepID=UPI0014086954|nr:OprD family porin [Chromobacterium vaccinii]MBX9356687.1 OprD family porin [Chromobacterium vaccinii]NHQ80914.1 OprD family porin [Chromobacterium vaccinii]
MHKKRVLFLAIMAVLSGHALAAEESSVPPGSDGPALKGTAQAIPESDVYDLLTKSETTFSALYYGRDRQAQWDAPGKGNRHDIHVNALNLGLNFKSGYAWDHLGFDAAAHAAIRLTKGQGWSEVLYHDLNDTSDPDENGGGKDKSSAVLSQAALKFRQSADGQGFSARAGYTPISIGTLGTSGGLQSHAYRGLEGKYKLGDFEVGYGWADQFRNEWDTRFRDMTNQWHQNRAPYNDGRKVDYVHSIGFRYAPSNYFVDVGFGEGKDYRRNAQIAASYTWSLGADKLTATGYYFTGKYQTALSGIANPKNEWHASGSLSYATGGWTLMGGYGATHAPDSGELNFRLTPWGNSDNRNFIQTWGQDDDFVWDGMRVVKIGVSYDFAKLGVPGLTMGASANYASNVKNQYDSARPNLGDTHFNEVDLSVAYSVQSGPLKGASIGVYPAQLRTHGFTGDKSNRNDVKVIASYSKTF